MSNLTELRSLGGRSSWPQKYLSALVVLHILTPVAMARLADDEQVKKIESTSPEASALLKLMYLTGEQNYSEINRMSCEFTASFRSYSSKATIELAGRIAKLGERRAYNYFIVNNPERKFGMMLTPQLSANLTWNENYGYFLLVDNMTSFSELWSNFRSRAYLFLDPLYHGGRYLPHTTITYPELVRQFEEMKLLGTDGVELISKARKVVCRYFRAEGSMPFCKRREIYLGVGDSIKPSSIESVEWAENDGLFYPSRFQTAVWIKDEKIVDVDLRITNVKINGKAEVNESTVGFAGFPGPKLIAGMDRRGGKLVEIVRDGNEIRPRRPGDKTLTKDEEIALAQERQEMFAKSVARMETKAEERITQSRTTIAMYVILGLLSAAALAWIANRFRRRHVTS